MHLLLILPVFQEKYHPLFIHTYWVERVHQYFMPLETVCTHFSFSVVMGAHVDRYWKKKFPKTYIKIQHKVVIDGWELQKNFKTFHVYHAAHQAFKDELPVSVSDAIKEQLSQQCDPAIYDLAISFFTKVAPVEAWLKDSVLFCYFSEGGITRAPFPISWKFDPIGFCSKSIASELALKAHWPDLDANQVALMSDFKEKLNRSILKKNPFEKKILNLRNTYKHLLLMPLQVSGRCSFDCLVSYEHQIEYLYSILTRVPEHTAVLLTEHPDYPVMTESLYQGLKDQFPFLMMDPDFLRTKNASLFLIPFVDGVINVSSSVGWLALLLGKALYVEGESEFSAFRTCAELERLFDFNRIPRYDAILYQLISRVWINEKTLLSPKSMKEIMTYFIEKKDFNLPSSFQKQDEVLEGIGRRKLYPQKQGFFYFLSHFKQAYRTRHFLKLRQWVDSVFRVIH